LYPKSDAHLHIPSKVLNGALLSTNCAKKTAGPFIVFILLYYDIVLNLALYLGEKCILNFLQVGSYKYREYHQKTIRNLK